MTDVTYFRPAGWADLRSRPLDEEGFERAVDVMVSDLTPRVRSLVRGQISDNMRDLIAGLGEAGATRVLFPARGALTQPIRPFLALLPLQGDTQDPVASLVSMAATDPTAELLDLPGRIALKTRASTDSSERTAEGVERQVEVIAAAFDLTPDMRNDPGEIRRRTVNLQYHVGIPGEADHWMTVFAGMSHEDSDGGRSAADVVEAFVDDWVATVRWADHV